MKPSQESGTQNAGVFVLALAVSHLSGILSANLIASLAASSENAEKKTKGAKADPPKDFNYRWRCYHVKASTLVIVCVALVSRRNVIQNNNNHSPDIGYYQTFSV